MGQIHNELRKGTLSRALKSLVGDDQAEGGLERYGETLTPTIDLWSPTQSEWALPRGERRFGVRGTTPIAPAGQFAALILAGTPNYQGVVERLRVSAQVVIGFAVGTPANFVNLKGFSFCKDARFMNAAQNNTKSPQLGVGYGDVGAVQNPSTDTLGAADYTFPGYVLSGVPLVLWIVQPTAASQFSFSLEWRERQIFSPLEDTKT